MTDTNVYFLFFFLYCFIAGGLSVLLVVGDTWCAVTDPLRYHSRISYAKSWLLIASVWIVGILVALASSLRGDCSLRIIDSVYFINEDIDSIYDLIYSCIFFMLIIVVPICTVCVMYWKIFSEARQSGMRMRRNGSSPLLQSSLNLSQTQMACHESALCESNRCPSLSDIDVLTMKIDETNKLNAMKSNQMVGTHQYRRFLDIPKTKKCSSDDEKSPTLKNKLAYFKSSNNSAATTEMTNGQMRQVHSSPNLQKLTNLDGVQKITCCSVNHSASNINNPVQQHQEQQQQSTTQASPKALSYMISIRHRLSNASSIFKYREESRTARISTLVVVMFLLSFFPFGLLVLMQSRIFFVANASLLSILFLLIGNVTSPFIFAYRNRRIRRGICRLFGVDAKPNNYLQKQRMQLRNEMATNASAQNAKQVRIHRNLSASNFSLNLMPYKIGGSANMLPMYLPHELYGITEHGSCSEDISSSQGSLDESKCDIDGNNNNSNHEECVKSPESDCRMSFLKRMFSRQSSEISGTSPRDNGPVEV